MNNSKPKFIDLFAGIGGFRSGFTSADYECVFSSEIDEKCQQVYYANYGEKPFGDIKTLNINDIPDFDVLTAGFPCQPFSICGRREGFSDTRGTLFFDICRIIDLKQPKVIVLENVKHLLHHNNGETFEVIKAQLTDLGFHVSYRLLNAKDFGVPQNRERLIIIGTKGQPFNFNHLIATQTLPLKAFLDKDGEFEYLNPEEYTLIDNPKIQESGLLFVGYRNKQIWKKGIRPNTEHLSRVHRQPNRIYSVEGVHPTLPSQETSGRFFIYEPAIDKVRRLTLNECYRIMGFPETFKRHESLTECYRQVGNSICVPMVNAIAKEIIIQGTLTQNAIPRKAQRYIQQLLFCS
jgi:DNA (cytosine-5)-methyltransferase 1